MQTSTNQLPKSLGDIKELCGEECMLSVWKAYTGTHLSVPKKCSSDHFLVKTIGQKNAAAMCDFFKGETLYIPKHDVVERLQRDERNKKIFSLRETGKTLACIAIEFKLSERQVINVVNQMRSPTPQVDVFS